MKLSVLKTLFIIILLLLIMYVFKLGDDYGLVATVTDASKLRHWVLETGHAGPVVIMLLMATAIIINPIPSAPIALTAGALYGHTWGTVYVVVGATIGAIGAFGISRLLGYELLQRYFGNRLNLGWLGSQNALMAMVFISRLIPFLSFDLVSYGAGLTSIKLWRFVVATLVGLIPASFLLAHFGGELTSSNLEQAMLTLLLLGVITVVPIAIKGLLSLYRRHKREVT